MFLAESSPHGREGTHAAKTKLYQSIKSFVGKVRLASENVVWWDLGLCQNESPLARKNDSIRSNEPGQNRILEGNDELPKAMQAIGHLRKVAE